MTDNDYAHRDLCSATAGILEAFHRMSEDPRYELDTFTVEEIIVHFNKKHDEHGAETPKPDVNLNSS
jgi:hypothetical protein